MIEFGLCYANTGWMATPDGAVAYARAAERAGFTSLWTVEHVIWPNEYSSTYPYSAGGKMAGEPSTPIPDPLIWLTWVAAATERIRLATGILLLPEHNPLTVAKQVATLDVLSGGRVDLGVGIGWLEEEFDAMGVPFHRRAARTDEYIRVLRTLWASDNASFHGEFVDFEGVSSNPKPLDGTVPIVIGGHSPGAARRAGRLGDSFWPGKGDFEGLAGLFTIARQAAEAAERDPDGLELCASPPFGRKELGAQVEQLVELGATRIILPAYFMLKPDPETAMAEFAAAVMAAVT
jgi:probable F420-dependent oxidoreductase